MALVGKTLVTIMALLVSSKFLLDSRSKICLLVSRPFQNYFSKPLCFQNLTERPIEILRKFVKGKLRKRKRLC